jgi:hypothetical protein
VKLKTLREPFGIARYHTDYWGAYERNLAPEVHNPGKRTTQQIEREHLLLRTRLKRLVRKTICFSTSLARHDIVTGVFINRYEFGLPVPIMKARSVTPPNRITLLRFRCQIIDKAGNLPHHLVLCRTRKSTSQRCP